MHWTMDSLSDEMRQPECVVLLRIKIIIAPTLGLLVKKIAETAVITR